MGKNMTKKFVALLLAMVMLVGVAPFDALANTDVLKQANTEAYLENNEYEVGEEFEITFSSSDSNNNVKLEIPNGITFLSATELIEEQADAVTIPGGKETKVKFVANAVGEYTLFYFDGEDSNKLSFNIVENKKQVEEPAENHEEVQKEEANQSEEVTEVEPDSNTRLVESDGKVSVDFVGYSDVEGLNSQTSYINMVVKFDFSLASTEERTLTITLPEGLRYIQIPIAGQYNTTNVDSNILNPLLPNEVITKSIEKMEIPTREGIVAPNNYTFGKTVYKFKNTIERGELTFRIKVDAYRYYGDHVMLSPVVVEMKDTSSNSIGKVEKKLNLVGLTNGGRTLKKYSDNQTSEVVSSSDDHTETGRTATKIVSFTSSGHLDSPNTYIKNLVLHTYYPEGMINPRVVYLDSREGEGLTTTIDPINSRITITSENEVLHSSVRYQVIYDVPKNMEAKEYSAKSTDTITFENYDGTKETWDIVDGYKEKTKVLDNSINKLSILAVQPLSYETDQGFDHIGILGTYEISNTTAGVKRNQVYEVEADSGIEMHRITFPYDNTTEEKPTKVEFKTSIYSEWQVKTLNLPVVNNNMKVVTTKNLELAPGDFVTHIKISMDDFSPGYTGAHLSARSGPLNPSIIGKLANGFSSQQFHVSTYDENDRAKTETKQSLTVTESKNSGARTTVSSSELEIKKNNKNIKQLEPGDDFNIKGFITLSEYPYGRYTFLQNPTLYLREPKNTVLDIDSVSLTQQISGVNTILVSGTDWKYEKYANHDGDQIYKITFLADASIGAFTDVDRGVARLLIDVPFSTTRALKGHVSVRDVFTMEKTGVGTYPMLGQYAPVIDTHDMNKNGDRTEMMLTSKEYLATVNELNSVLMESFISVEGEGTKLPYDENDPTTAILFNPGTNARYYIDMMNYTINDASKAVMYIPIPKFGTNFGTDFQSEAFKWNMKLTDKLVLPPEMESKFKVSYGIGLDQSNWETGPYYDAPQFYEDVNMIRIENVGAVAVDAEYSFSVPMTVDETYNSAQQGDKLGKINVYNPLVDVDSGTFTGKVKGSKVGAQLDITEISGRVFYDLHKSGKNDESSQAAVKGHTVSLYKKNEDTDTYEAVLNSSGMPVTTTTDGNGKYVFDYEDGLRLGEYGVKFGMIGGYELTFHEGSDRRLNSQAIYKKDYPNAGDDYRGWVLGVEATDVHSDKVNAGYLKYSADDLGVSILDKVRRISDKESIVIPATDLTVTPDFYEKIKGDPKFTWNATSNSDQVTLSTDADGNVTIAAKDLAGGVKDVGITVTIKDMYGYTKESNTVYINIYSTTPPTVTGNPLIVSVGDTTDIYTGISAKDNAGHDIVLTNSNKEIEHSIPMDGAKFTTAGTYSAKYKVKDSNGIEGEHSRLVKVVGLVDITANPQVYEITDPNISDSVEAAASASYLAAPDVVGSGVPTNVTPKMKIVSGPSTTDFSEAGMYKVEYSAKNSEGVEAMKLVDVLVKSKTAVTEDSVILEAEGFIIENSDAKFMSETKAKDSNHAKVKAYKVTEDSGVIVSITEITNKVSADSTHIDAIKAVSILGDVFDLKFTVVDGDTAEKTVKVAVKGDNTVIVDDFAITAKDYTVSRDEVPTSDPDKIDQLIDPNYGKISVVSIKDESKNPVSVDIDHSAYVNEAGVHKVTFKAPLYAGVEGELFVTVKDNAEIKDGYKIAANNIVISKHEAKRVIALNNVQQGDYFVDAMKPEVTRVDGTSDGAVGRFNQSLLQTDPGTYEVEFYVSAKPTTTVTAYVTVLDKDVVVTDGQYVIAANHFMIGVDNLPTTAQDKVNRALAVVYHRDDLTTDLGATTASILTKEIKKQDVTFTSKTITDQPNLKADVQADVVKDSVIDGTTYVLKSKDEITIQKHEAEQFLLDGLGIGKDIILEADAEAFEQGNLSNKGTVTVLSLDFTGDLSGTMTLGVVEDTSISKTVVVTVQNANEPFLKVDPHTMFVDLDDSFDYRFGVEAEDKDNPTNIIDWTHNNLTIEPLYGAPDHDKIDASKQGVYTYKYTAKDLNGKTASKVRVVVVQDPDHPIEVINDYYVVADNIMKKPSDFADDETTNEGLILNYSNAYAVHKTSGKREEVEVSNLNGFTNKVGTYDVSLRPKVVGITKDHKIKVVLTDGGIDDRGSYLITADNATVGKARARVIIADTLNIELFKEMNVVAIHKTDASAVPTILVSGKPTSETPAQSHPVDFTVSEDIKSTINRSLKITKDEEVDVADKIVLGANPFIVGREDIEDMNAEAGYTTYITLSGANAYHEDTPTTPLEVVPMTFLSKTGANTQFVEFAVIDPNGTLPLDSPRVTVKVKVEGDRAVTDGKYTLVGEHFTITGAQAYTLMNTDADDDSNDSILLDGGKLTSYLHQDYLFTEEGTPVVFDRSAISTTSGDYDVVFSLKENEDIKLTLTVTVDTKKKAILDVENYSVVDVKDVFAPKEQYNEGFDYNDNGREIDYDELLVDDTKVVNGKVGFYGVTYTYVDAAGQTTTELHVVAVTDGSIVTDGEYLIYGENVVLKTAEVTGDVDALVKSKANVSAYKKSNANGEIEKVLVDDITMDASKVSATVGDYPAIIGIKDKADTKGIRVYVTNGEINKEDEYTIVTDDTTIGQKDAVKTKDELDSIIIKKSGTYAVHKTKSDLGTIKAAHSIKKDVKTYDVTYSVEESGESADAHVHVVADEVVENEGYIYIAANSFLVGKENVDGLTDDLYIKHAKARTWEEKFDSGTKAVNFVGPKVDKTQIDTLQPIEFGVDLNDSLIDKPRAIVNVKVLDGKTERGDDYTLFGKNFDITGAQALLLMNTDADDDTNDHILLDGGELASFLNNSFEESGTPIVLDRSAISTTKGTYFVTFGIKEDDSVELVLEVTVDLKKKAELDVKNYSVVTINETFDPKIQYNGGTDFNDNNRAIEYDELVVDDSKVVNGKVGFYEVTYTYVDAAGQTTTKLHVVAVTDGSIVTDGEYLIYGENVVLKTEDVKGDVDELVKGKANVSAYLKTNDKGNITKVDYEDITMDADDVKAQAGKYDAIIGIKGKTDTKGIKVYVTDGDIHKEDEYTIITNDTTIGQKDAAKAKTELDPIIIEKSGTIAVHKTKATQGTIEAAHNIKKDVNSYAVTYNVTESGESADAFVHVVADEVVENKGYIYIAANSFLVGEENVDGLTDDLYIKHAKARTWEEKFDSGTKAVNFVGPKVNKALVDVLQPIEFGVDLNDTLIDEPRALVDVKVVAGKTDRGDDYTLSGKHFEISGVDAYTLMKTKDDDDLNDSILLNGGGLKSYLNNSFVESGTPIVLNRKAIKNETGSYDVVFGIKEDDSVKLTLKVSVKMPKATELDVKPYSEINVDEVFDAEQQFNSGTDYGISYAIKFTDLDVDTDDVDTSKKGIYEVPYVYVDSAGLTHTRIHVLVVNDGSIVIVDDEYIIDANNFMIDEKDVIENDAAHVLNKSGAQSYRLSDNKWIDTEVKDFGGYKVEKGKYTITLNAKGDTDAVKEIIAEVVFGDIKPGVDYLISATDMTLGYKDAANITDSELIARANAIAIHKSLNTPAIIRIRETDLKPVPGSYTITFEVVEDPTTFITTNITVLDDEVVIEDKDYIIAASSFGVGDKFILEMDKKDIVALAGAKAWAKKDPSIMLEVTQTEDIITAIGDHKVSFHIVSNPDISVQVDKTIFKDVMYELEAYDAEIDIDDLTKAINADNLDQTILSITKSRGYRVHPDGSKTNMQVYVADSTSLLNAKAGQSVQVMLTLKDPNTRDTRDVSSDHRLEDTTLPVLINVTSENKGKDKDKDGVNTGIFNNTTQMLVVLTGAVGFLLILAVSEKKRRRNLED